MAKAREPGGSDFVVNMLLAKETKGALQYKEVDDKGNVADFGVAKIGTLYLRKSALPGVTPKAISVQVNVRS